MKKILKREASSASDNLAGHHKHLAGQTATKAHMTAAATKDMANHVAPKTQQRVHGLHQARCMCGDNLTAAATRE